MAKHKAKGVSVKKVTDTSEVEMMLNSPEALEDAGVMVKEKPLKTNEFYDTVVQGDLKGTSLSTIDHQQTIKDKWLDEKDTIPKNQWKYILINVPTINPVSAEITQEQINKRVKKEKDGFVMTHKEVQQSMKNSIWNTGDVFLVPPGVAKIYCGIRYDMGLQGWGDTGKMSVPGLKHDRIYVTVATEITEEDAIRRRAEAIRKAREL